MKFVENKLGERGVDDSFTSVAQSPDSNHLSTDVKTSSHLLKLRHASKRC